jgi:hypothetical protein
MNYRGQKKAWTTCAFNDSLNPDLISNEQGKLQADGLCVRIAQTAIFFREPVTKNAGTIHYMFGVSQTVHFGGFFHKIKMYKLYRTSGSTTLAECL